MRIGLDGHTLGTGAGGNETYVRGLLEGLATLGDEFEVVVYVGPDGPAEADGSWRQTRIVRLRSDGPIRRLGWELPRRLARDEIDVAHFQYVAPLVAPCPLVVAVHDPSFLLAPELLGRRLALRLRWSTRLALRQSAAVLVPSGWTRRMLASRYAGAAERIHVVPLGRSERFSAVPERNDGARRRELGLPERYLLYVGRRQRRKNVVGLLGAYRQAVAGDPAVPPLVLAGPSGPDDDRIRGEVRRGGLSGRVLLLSDVGDEVLPAVYRGADLFCYPARYEGFGLPVLEAMSCGLAVVAAEEGALPELVGNAGVLIPPDDVQLWAAAMVDLQRDPERRRDLGRRGRRHAGEYSWQRTAELTLAHYSAAVSGSPPG